MTSRNKVAENVNEIMTAVENSWTEIDLLSMKRLDDLKDVLYQWADYTEAMKGLMKWLREAEENIKQPLYKLTVKELETKLLQYQVSIKNIISKEKVRKK